MRKSHVLKTKSSPNIANHAIYAYYALSMKLDDYLHLNGLTGPKFAEQIGVDATLFELLRDIYRDAGTDANVRSGVFSAAARLDELEQGERSQNPPIGATPADPVEREFHLIEEEKFLFKLKRSPDPQGHGKIDAGHYRSRTWRPGPGRPLGRDCRSGSQYACGPKSRELFKSPGVWGHDDAA